ncbi:MAG: hypothetical protein H6845_00275 [Alphaproteobacteria bacterium]|nr:MAG: hypothetical protein H6845_00275 [Alphaproteobacteria bacterium]
MSFDSLVDPGKLIQEYRCIAVFGKNDNVARSMFDEFSGVRVEFKELERINLLQQSLIPERDIKVTATVKEFEKFMKENAENSSKWGRCVIFLLDSNVTSKYKNVAFIGCNFVNMSKFINFHKERLGYDLCNDDLIWVEDLYDLHFANKVSKIDQNAVKLMGSVSVDQMDLLKKGDKASAYALWKILDNPWPFMKQAKYVYKYKHKDISASLMDHLDMWARRYTPNDEVLIWLIGSILMR